jgi:hypothetical protein
LKQKGEQGNRDPHRDDNIGFPARQEKTD